ncbi:DUF2237 family protein [Desulfosediminicola flagellatus]|uniref:DUF2237 family protein n=1 Tax=Desulfosediminicola flagellatus TaxID=2569541 RepID=UPI0010ABD648|nr:DUF2237 domain-containing protein [Desulfosediminicola flagellatus]
MNTNVLGTPLEICGLDPITGFTRQGSCATGENDTGRHVVCAMVTEEFLIFSKEQGNDLTTPMPLANFPGLRPGDHWCLCANRWKEALENGVAPPVILAATHSSALEIVSLEDLLTHSYHDGLC